MRLAGAAWLIALLFWLPIEDTTAVAPLAFGLNGVAWLAWRYLPGAPVSPIKATLLGAAAGLAVPVAALLLMAFKSGIHGHGFAEYTAAQVWFVIQTTPLALLGGILVGLIAHLLRRHL